MLPLKYMLNPATLLADCTLTKIRWPFVSCTNRKSPLSSLKKAKKQGVKFADFSQNPFPWQHAKIDTWRPLWGPELQFWRHHSITAIYCLNWVPTIPNSVHIFIYTATQFKYGIICCSLIITLPHTTAWMQKTCVLIGTTRHCRPEPNHRHGVFIGVKP